MGPLGLGSRLWCGLAEMLPGLNIWRGLVGMRPRLSIPPGRLPPLRRPPAVCHRSDGWDCMLDCHASHGKYVRVCVQKPSTCVAIYMHLSKCGCESFSNNNHGYDYSQQCSYAHYHYVLTTTYYDHDCYYVWKSLFAFWTSMLLNNHRCWLCL